MSESDSLIDLYSNRILSLAAEIPLTDRLTKPQATVKKRSPLCGSMITVDLKIKNKMISEFGQDVRACALGQASASILAQNIIGRTRDEISTLRTLVNNMLVNGDAPPNNLFKEYKVLYPAKDYKNRHASILLAIEATLEAFDQIM